MSNRTIAEFVDDLKRMPRLGGDPKLSREALTVLLDGRELSVHTLKVRVADVDLETGRVTLEFAFCDENDQVIINIGRHNMGSGDIMRLAKVGSPLVFTIT